ncbi:MAG TPA: peptidylprolyl isomerase, partial [Candidatus Polarisedimenticolia bacterium]|nr:peptidylprolyl isomerase [Candidatus Polarisedimenticolia bacterium]
MLQQMREQFRYLKWLLVLVVFMFGVWAFATWTGGSGGRVSNEPTWAAKVNGEVVDGQAYLNYARQLDNTYQQMFREQYAQQRALIRVGRQAMNTLVDEELLYQAARAQGLSVAPAEVAAAITRDPSFQENGKFIGVERYRNMFSAARISVGDYEKHLERRLLVEKYRNLVGSGATVSDGEVEREFARRNQKTTLDYVVVDPTKLTSATPDEARLRAYYDAHRDRYLRGEGRTGLFVLINARELAATINVADADVRAAYDRDLASRYTTKEQRRASHILFKVPSGASDAETRKIEAKAEGVLKRAQAGGDFAALARQFSEDSSAQAGGDLNFFGRGQMVKEFEEPAFTLPVGSISNLVKSTFGYHIIKVTDTRAAAVQPFESVRDRIRQEIAVDRAGTQAGDRAAAIAQAAAGGRLDEAARAAGLKATETGPVRPGD